MSGAPHATDARHSGAGARKGLDGLALWHNPIFRMGVRTRLRPRQLFVTALLTGTVTAFFFFITYLTTLERGVFDSASAARATLLPMLVVQGFVLMFLGTGAVASGVAQEKENGLLDYHRMTPMSPTSKIVGYLFGLPVREYFMFALTLPFIAYAVLAGGISILRIVQLYAVFFSAVVLYHMTGFVAGMVSRHPRRAGWFARMLVVALYLLLPQLAEMGFSIFGYLTIWPAFQGLVRAELGFDDVGEFLDAQRWASAAFYGANLDPMVFSLLLQGFVIATFFVMAHRKWRQPTNHALSKPQALVFYGVLQLLVIGSLWPYLTRGGGGGGLVELATMQLAPSVFLRVALYTYLLLGLVVSLWLVHVTTSERHAIVQGLRRARKRGQARPEATHDAASSVWVALALAAITVLGYAVLLLLAHDHAMFGSGAEPGLAAQIAPAWLFAAILVYAQAIREAHGGRGLALFGFVAWAVPPLVSLILLSAWGEVIVASYVSLPSPIGGLLFAVFDLFRDGADALDDDGHLPILTGIATIVASAAAVQSQLQLRRAHRAFAEEVGAPPSERDAG